MEKYPGNKAIQVIKLLAHAYPDKNNTELIFESPFELLVATVLSAQSTDKQVNKITRELFRKYNRPEDFASLSPDELEPLIRQCGLYKNKSRNIIKASQMLVQEYDSQVPEKFSELMKLPGVGRKTANVVQTVLYNKPTMPVDTHVFRVSKRLGLVKGDHPEKVEKELLDIIPPGERNGFHHRVIAHGRNVCRARKPLCPECILADLCSERPQQA